MPAFAQTAAGGPSAAPPGRTPVAPPAARPARPPIAPRGGGARPPPATGTIQSIKVEGNQRIEAGTIGPTCWCNPATRSTPTASTAA